LLKVGYLRMKFLLRLNGFAFCLYWFNLFLSRNLVIEQINDFVVLVILKRFNIIYYICNSFLQRITKWQKS